MFVEANLERILLMEINLNNLLLVGFLPLLTVFVLVFLPQNFFKILRGISMGSAFFSFFSSFLLLMSFDSFFSGFQNVINLYHFTGLNIHYSIGLDGISIWFVFLNSLLIFLSVFLINKYSINSKVFFILLFLIQFFVVQSFLVLDLFMFYVYFEAILIPMFFLIGVWGSYDRNLHAAFVFFLYTLVGSLIMLLAMQYIQVEVGSTYYTALQNYDFDKYSQVFLFLAFFVAFAVKIPMFPLHVWLPEAHGEAPTIGSMILAGILLKLGIYGFIRVLIPVCYDVLYVFAPFVYLICLLGILYTAFSTVIQTDIKRVIAYSSVGHMNLAVLGLFTMTNVGIEGSMFSVISHGFISPGMFLGVGLLYDRYGTKLISYYGNLVMFMPVLTVTMFLLSLGNLAFPGTSAFVGEFMLFSGIIGSNFLIFLLSSVSVILVAIYTFWLFNRLFFGPYNLNVVKFADLTINETFCFFVLIFFMIVLGIYPSIVLDTLHYSILNIK